jgi:ribosomal protein L16 Arg81 hydroxylase
MNSQSDWLDQNLFNSISKKKFFSDVQGKTWFHTRLTDQANNELPSWDDLNSFLSNQRLSHPRVRMSREGATTDELTILSQRPTLRGELVFDTLQNRVYDNLRLGSTLVLDAVDIAIPKVRRITSSLNSTFLAKSQANGYLTFSESRGFGLHWDDHDVFIVQVYGNKTWHLYGNTRMAPMHRDFHDEHSQPNEILETIELTPGSLLYVPRGCWHDVVGKGEPTFHLTFGITPPTGIDVLGWLQETGRQQDFLRQDIPIHQPAALEKYSNNFKDVILEFLQEDLIDQFIEDVKRTTAAPPIFSLPYGIDNTNLPPTGAIINLVPNTLNIKEEKDLVFIEANNLKWKLPKIALKLVLNLQSNDISVAESYKVCCNDSEYSQDEWVEFLNDLIAQGLIAISFRE